MFSALVILVLAGSTLQYPILKQCPGMGCHGMVVVASEDLEGEDAGTDDSERAGQNMRKQCPGMGCHGRDVVASEDLEGEDAGTDDSTRAGKNMRKQCPWKPFPCGF